MRNAVLIILLLSFAAPGRAQRATDTFKLYFDLGVPALSKASEKKIDLLIYNDKIIHGSLVMIIGYADYVGTVGRNKNLSKSRATNVKNYLVKYGISPDDIVMCEGKGEIHRADMTDPTGMPVDRRVEIVVNNHTRRKTPPEEPKEPYKPRTDSGKKVVINDFSEIKRLKPGTTFLLKNVYFPPDRHIIKSESKETLEKLFGVLRDYPSLKISIEGHVCCIKDYADAWDIDTYEPTLSVNRAKAIYNYLVSKGIDSARLRYAGFGRRRPVIADERTEEDAEKNRRVELRIIENK